MQAAEARSVGLEEGGSAELLAGVAAALVLVTAAPDAASAVPIPRAGTLA